MCKLRVSNPAVLPLVDLVVIQNSQNLSYRRNSLFAATPPCPPVVM